jgi:L-fuconolactonase
MTIHTPGSNEWLKSVTERTIDPDRLIIDPHHHLWRRPNGNDYLLENLWQDTGSGHNIQKTVFVECHAEYRTEGLEAFKVLGETEFVTEQAKLSETAPGSDSNATISGIVGHADLTLGDQVQDILYRHIELAEGRFRGIRHAGAHAERPEALTIIGRAPKSLYLNQDFQQGVRKLGELGLTFDTWHYHYQNQEFNTLAQNTEGTQLILDHFGSPLGVGPYANQRDEIFTQWKKDIAEIARNPNVVAKIGGLAMPDNGFGWHERATPPSSDEFVAAQRDYYLHTIDCFGPERCMFESNFPVDRFSISYHVLYNGLKKIVADFSEADKHAMFYGTAARIYKL